MNPIPIGNMGSDIGSQRLFHQAPGLLRIYGRLGTRNAASVIAPRLSVSFGPLAISDSIKKTGTKNQQYCLNAHPRPSNSDDAHRRSRKCQARSTNAMQMPSLSMSTEYPNTVTVLAAARMLHRRSPGGASETSQTRSAKYATI